MAGLSAKAIGRDVLIVVALSVVAGFYTSLAMPGKLGTAEFASASSLLTLVLVTVGFTIVACFSPNNRWLQLLIVGGLTWFLGGIFNILVYGLSLENWLKQIAHFAVMVAVGGGFSYIFQYKQIIREANKN